MPLQNHLAELERKHDTLERALHEAATCPSTDEARLSELKRRKLQLKDEMSRLRPPATPVR